MAGMTNNSNQRAAVEQIVRQVLAELRTGGRDPVKAQGMPSLGTPSTNGQLTLTTKVITAAALEGRLSNVTHLLVPRGAVFTPAARDELKRFKVTIASTVDVAKPAGDATIYLGVAATSYDAKPLSSALSADGVNVQCLGSGPLSEIIAALGKANGNDFALLVTDHAAAALCLANRQRGVRAALGSDPAAIDLAVSTLGPNLLVIEPQARSVFQMKQVIRHWLRGGLPTCPATLQAHLA